MKRENKWKAPDLVAVKQSKTKKVIGSSRMVRENNSLGFGPPLGYTCKNNNKLGFGPPLAPPASAEV
jgi:hypothetical protein